MSSRNAKTRFGLPSVDAVVRSKEGQATVARFGRTAFVGAIRIVLHEIRTSVGPHGRSQSVSDVAAIALRRLEEAEAPKLRRVFNLTGTVVHTNLGRSALADTAIEAAVIAMRSPTTLEFDIKTGKRGERDEIVRDLLCDLTGAENVCVVNNNAAAVLLVLMALARERETVVSRGELIEIGGSFRMPDIMAAAGTRLVEVGTTNRTHKHDYENAISSATALLLKVHTSNYVIRGFAADVSTRELVAIGSSKGIPVIDDLGSGTLMDLAPYGLRRERTVQDAISDGADLVTFSGDKLLGGPQVGFIVGRADLIKQCVGHPIKRALRIDKIRMAALEATLRLYKHPEMLHMTLPTLRDIARPSPTIRVQCEQMAPFFAASLGEDYDVTVEACMSQVGSGALPLEALPSFCLAIRPRGKVSRGRRLESLSVRLRSLPIPVIGRISEGALLLDLRCLDDEDNLLSSIQQLSDVPSG